MVKHVGKQWGIIFLLFSIGRTPLICFEDDDLVLVTSGGEGEGEEGCSWELSLQVRVFMESLITAIFVTLAP